MKQWSVSMIFDKYLYHHEGATMSLRKETTTLVVRHVTGLCAEHAFGFAYYDAQKTVRGYQLFSHSVLEIVPIKRVSKKT
jgi:hypothetical protein